MHDSASKGEVLFSRMLLFAKNFFKHPAMLGSVVPSSPFLVKDLLGQIDWERSRVIVEYGPGVGTVTTEILKRMRADAVLVVIELNSDFVRFLRKRIVDPRLRIFQGSAADVCQALAQHNLHHADYVISSIPYSTMSEVVRRDILQRTHDVLHPDGALLVYQFTRTVLPYLQSSFGSVQQGFQLLNIPPALIFYCTPKGFAPQNSFSRWEGRTIPVECVRQQVGVISSNSD